MDPLSWSIKSLDFLPFILYTWIKIQGRDQRKCRLSTIQQKNRRQGAGEEGEGSLHLPTHLLVQIAYVWMINDDIYIGILLDYFLHFDSELFWSNLKFISPKYK